MPSIRKRIGYLPSINAQETITKISTREKLSQSKVVGILVEEALIARGEINPQNSHNFIRENVPSKNNKIKDSSFKNNDFDELISDKGIIYKTKKYNQKSDDKSSDPLEKYNEEIFEQFKQFILFSKNNSR